MIRSLRKRHRQIWIAWAILLPIGIISAWLVIPNQSAVKLLQADTSAPLPVIVQSKSFDNYDVTIRSNQGKSSWQLEWKNKKILMIPSAVIYKVTGPSFQPETGELIGRIETKGSYLFPLIIDSTAVKGLHLVLYDFIHQQTVENINF